MTVAHLKPRTHECGICGKKKRADLMVYSKHTGAYYCKRHLTTAGKAS